MTFVLRIAALNIAEATNGPGGLVSRMKRNDDGHYKEFRSGIGLPESLVKWDLGWDLTSFIPVNIPTLVVVQVSEHETKTYKVVSSTTTYRSGLLLPPRSVTTPVVSGEIFDVSSYKFKTWIIDRKSKQVRGCREFTPDPLPSNVEYGVERKMLDHQVDLLYEWLGLLYKREQ